MSAHAFLALSFVVSGGATSAFAQQDLLPGAPIRIAPVPENLAAVDLDGDRRVELVSVQDGQVCLLVGGVCDPLPIPGRATLWTAADWNRDGRNEMLVLVDGKTLQKVELVDGSMQLGAALAEGLDGTPPLGIRPASFLRDLDENGYPDLIVPRADKVLIWHGTREGLVRGPEVGGLVRLALEVGDRNEGLLSKYSRTMILPEPDTADVSGDGTPDLLVRYEDQVRQYIASADGFPGVPSVQIELDQFREEFDEATIDLGNLTKLLKFIVVDEWADLNDDGALDLLVLSAGKVRIFLGDKLGVSLERNKRPVKLDGNIFYAKAAEISGDGIPDLVLVGIEDLGLADLAISFITSFKMRFYFYVFRGKGDGSFHPRVYKEKAVVVEGGRLLSLIEDNRDQLAAMRESIVRIADIDGSGKVDDLVLLDSTGKLGVWYNASPSDTPFGDLAEGFLRRAFGERGQLEVDVGTLTEWVLGRTSALIAQTRDAPPDWSVHMPEGWKTPHGLVARDFDGDGRDEVLVLRRWTPPTEEGAESSGPELDGWLLDPPGGI
ncbi:MAG: VCBS repeat-containing protein [Planctomycetes bacterium]|nr:VCBS repeat-containing protein [Planctomycetota bacterium]